jgi:hypothetical protein
MPATNREEGLVRFLWFAAAALTGLAAGCKDDWSALKPPADLIKLDTWTNVPEGQYDVHGRVGDVFHLPLGKAMDRTGLGWLRATINNNPQQTPEFDDSSDAVAYVFRADHPGRYQVEIRREIVRVTDPSDNPEAEPEPPRKVDSSWPPRTWTITISE